MLRLWDEVREGLLAVVRDVGPLSAIGIDTFELILQLQKVRHIVLYIKIKQG